MSCVFVSVGQCGNQVLSSFLEHASTITSSREAVTNYAEQYRAVCIDTEEKVVSAIHKRISQKKIPYQNLIQGRRGRGSNWSYGYHGHSAEENLIPDSLNVIRREMERCDACMGVALFHGLAGGTGSGLGSRLLVELRDEFALHHLMNCAVTPHSLGESPLQVYNQLLTLACLSRHSDGILLFSNDQLLYHLNHGLRNEISLKSSLSHKTGLHEMNNLIAQQLNALLTPSRSLYCAALDLDKSITHLPIAVNLEPWELLRSVCSLPQCKFVNITSSHTMTMLRSMDKIKPKSQSSTSSTTKPCNISIPDWNKISKDLTNNYRHSFVPTFLQDSEDVTRVRCISAVCSVRGDSLNNFTGEASMKLNQQLQRLLKPVEWNPFSIDYWVDSNSQVPSSYTVAFNDAIAIRRHLAAIVKQAQTKFETKAYLHWYYRHGCCETDFFDAFEQCETIMEAYSDMSASS